VRASWIDVKVKVKERVQFQTSRLMRFLSFELTNEHTRRIALTTSIL